MVPGDFFWADMLAYVHAALRAATYAVASLLLVFGIDDLLFDLSHHLRKLYRRLYVMRRHRPLDLAQLAVVEEKRTAILLPAWREADVIADMLHHLLESLDFSTYTVFVGIYPNDPDTKKALAPFANDPRIQIITNHQPGPTNKGDCLNVIVEGLFRHEHQTRERFEVFVLHDAEDVAHPLELKLFSLLIPRKDMVQLPVVPLEAAPLALTAAHYMDEFAEHHAKDLPIREAFSGGVPSAGVGCAFSRHAIKVLMEESGGGPFDTGSLTEDYAAAIQLQHLGLPLIFVRLDMQQLSGAPWIPGRGRRSNLIIGTREFFPRTVRDSVKQKARWLTGIVFQGWKSFGWNGPLSVRYALYRDRKAILAAHLALFANLLVLVFLVLAIGRLAGLIPFQYPPLVSMGSPLFYLLMANALLLFNRLAHRCYYVYIMYGPVHAAAAPLRLLWGNFINFLASNLAAWQALKSLLTGRRTAWAKTAHRFPDAADIPVLTPPRSKTA